MEIEFVGGKTFHDDSAVQLSETHYPVNITMAYRKAFELNDLFTVVVRDHEANYIHSLIINSSLTEQPSGMVVLPYLHPVLADHAYLFEIYIQPKRLKKPEVTRAYFNFDLWMGDERLELVRRITLTTSIRDPHQKYCSCILKVEAKNLSGKYKHVNPYAICAASTKGGMPSCKAYRNLEQLPLDQLQAYASLEGISPLPATKEEALRVLKKWEHTSIDVWEDR